MATAKKARDKRGKFTKSGAARFGSKGGANRAKNMSAKRRSEIAKRAALARHHPELLASENYNITN